jgi:hypothetical protein
MRIKEIKGVRAVPHPAGGPYIKVLAAGRIGT